MARFLEESDNHSAFTLFYRRKTLGEEVDIKKNLEKIEQKPDIEFLDELTTKKYGFQEIGYTWPGE